MRRYVYILLILALMAASLPGITTSFAQGGNEPLPIPIHLRARTFTPADAPGQVSPDSLATVVGNDYFIVQFRGPIDPAWKAQAQALGVEFLDYLPDFAFKVRMNAAVIPQLRALPQINWIGSYLPGYKINPNLQRADNNLLHVKIERGVSPDSVAAAIAATGAQVVGGNGQVLRVWATADQIDSVAAVPDVAWIEAFTIREKHNEYGGGVIMGSNTANANGYDGSTQTVAVADTGLGGGTAATAHPDIPSSRITAIYDWPAADSSGCYDAINDGPQDVDSGHGTHTSASVLSDGDANGMGKGTAPAAKLVFQATEDYADMQGYCSFLYEDGYYLLGLPDDIRDLFTQAYNAGARIHSNSWGSSKAGEYTDDAVNADDFMWNHRDMLITFSAGNDGKDGNSDGYVDEDSMGSPATAKNVLSVGASENDRSGSYPCDSNLDYTDCAAQGGSNDLFTYNEAWPDDFPADPIASDELAGNAEQMAGFSSRGPTDDGRIKPDVVAPGTYILSAYSDMYQQGYDASPNPQNNAWQYDGWGFPYNQYYKYMGGTSMSNPLTAGGAAVVRDFYQKAYGHAASAALTKATLINSAVDMLDENNDGVNDNAYPIPNNHEGWGRVNLAEATDGTAKYVDETSGLNTNGTMTYQYTVGSAGSPFKVTLVWTDYPGTAAASKTLVNDLDLKVTSPGGDVYYGNVFNGGWSTTGGSADRTNNVENVYVQAAASGTWTVEVKGYNVPNGPQPFALVVDGSFGSAPPPTATPTNTPVPPTATPTNTPVPPTATPTNTPVPPSATPTNTPVPPTATPTNTPAPTATPTNTPPGPTATPTNTPVPPTATPTNTPAPPTATPTNTPVPPTATPTNTPVPPTATPTPGSGADVIYLSSTSGGTIDGVSFKDEDILKYDTATDTWSLYFDGSDVGLKTDVNAFTILDDGSILLSINNVTGLSIGSVQDEDIIKFIPTSLGSNTAGSFEWYFDGSDVGLSASGEDIDAIGFTDDGKLVISTLGNFNAGGVSGKDEDLWVFTADSLGTSTSGSWEQYFDGSDVGLSESGYEDVFGTWIAANGDIYLTTRGGFSVPGLSGDGSDIFTFTPSSLGSSTSGSYSAYWDGSDHGFGSEIVDGIYIQR